MADWNNQKFAMPMYRDFVPDAVRPWLYLLCAFMFQLTGSVYFGNLQHMMGEWSLMREDVQFVLMCGVVGVNMPFPFLFRYKLRFTNRQLLINAALIIAACNILSLYVTWLPALCLISYVAGFFKLCGTFECFSNIRLWLSPKQDFGIFLPSMYIFILAAMPGGNWIAQQATILTGSWQAVHWLMTALMLMLSLFVYTCTRPWRFMKPLPLVSLDWLGCFMWSSLMLIVIWLFTYGEYYNWTDSSFWCQVLCAFPVMLFLTISRMLVIRHPYIDPRVWPHARLLPILGMFFVAEVMNATPHALQNPLTSSVLHWGYTTTSQFYLFEMLGYALGCIFTILWAGDSSDPRWGNVPRMGFKYTRLLTVGFFCLLMYQVMMYFYVSPTLNVERLWLPTVLRAFGYAIFFSTMTIYLKDLIEFPTFFHALTVSGFIRNGVGESVCTGIYGYGLRRGINDALARGMQSDFTQVLMAAIKEMFGYMCLIGSAVLLLMMLYDVQPVRSTMRKMLTDNWIGRKVKHRLKVEQKI